MALTQIQLKHHSCITILLYPFVIAQHLTRCWFPWLYFKAAHATQGTQAAVQRETWWEVTCRFRVNRVSLISISFTIHSHLFSKNPWNIYAVNYFYKLKLQNEIEFNLFEFNSSKLICFHSFVWESKSFNPVQFPHSQVLLVI